MFQKVAKTTNTAITSPSKHLVSENCSPVQCRPVVSNINFDVRLIQKKVAGWDNITLSKNVNVYHGTSPENANNIKQNGINPDQENGYDGGQLGKGFYTYTTPDQAQYFGNVVLHFKTKRDLSGQDVPNELSWKPLPEDAYTDNDFLHIKEDENQYKFHNGNNDLEFIDERVYDNPV